MSFNKKEIDAICDAIAGNLMSRGVTVFNFDDNLCEKLLSGCILANKIIPIFREHKEKIYSIIEKDMTVS